MSRASLHLAPRLDLRAIGPLHREILSHRGADLALDAARVDHLGALALQLIRAAAQTWAKDGHDLAVENVSNDLADQIALLGFSAKSVTRWESPR